uniref:Uncharacterized protein n=1 Tax=Helianthus annuus TaxID=4232 RepID=A0A251T5I4_HELAN
MMAVHRVALVFLRQRPCVILLLIRKEHDSNSEQINGVSQNLTHPYCINVC